MQTLSLHIEYLLRTRDCVILPGIGAFLRTHRSSVVGERGELIPGAVQICFNSSITATDGLLAHSVARRASLSYEQASVHVAEAAQEVRNALDTDGEATLGRLGVLSLNSEGHISFKPYSRLDAVIWDSIAPLCAQAEIETEDTTPTNAQESQADSKYYVLRIPRRVVRYAAISTMVLIAAATAILPSATRFGVGPVSGERQMASVVPGISHSTSVKEEVTTMPAVTATPEQAPQIVEPTQSDKFYLIVATFASEADCNKFISTQSDAADLRIVTSGKTSRVYSASSQDRDELLALMRTSEHKSMHPQAWIWEMH